MTVKDLLESEEVKENILEYNQIIIIRKCKSHIMKDEYLNRQVESWQPEIDPKYGLDYPYITIFLVNDLRYYWFLVKRQKKTQILELSKGVKKMEYLLYIFLDFVFILILFIMKEVENFINK